MAERHEAALRRAAAEFFMTFHDRIQFPIWDAPRDVRIASGALAMAIWEFIARVSSHDYSGLAPRDSSDSPFVHRETICKVGNVSFGFYVLAEHISTEYAEWSKRHVYVFVGLRAVSSEVDGDETILWHVPSATVAMFFSNGDRSVSAASPDTIIRNAYQLVGSIVEHDQSECAMPVGCKVDFGDVCALCSAISSAADRAVDVILSCNLLGG